MNGAGGEKSIEIFFVLNSEDSKNVGFLKIFTY